MKNSNLDFLNERIKIFVAERDWDKFHSPKNLAMALSGEVGELISHFQWLSEQESYLKHDEKKFMEVKEEIADVFLYLMMLSNKLGVDIVSIAMDKIDKNEIKYPVSLSRGKATKYSDF